MKKCNVDELIRLVVEFSGITTDELFSRCRKVEYVQARALVAYVLCYYGISNTLVGKVLLRHHASITHYKRLFLDDKLTQTNLGFFKDFMAGKGYFVPSLETWVADLSEMNVSGTVIRSYEK